MAIHLEDSQITTTWLGPEGRRDLSFALQGDTDTTDAVDEPLEGPDVADAADVTDAADAVDAGEDVDGTDSPA